MAGSPVRRAKRAVEDASRALQEGREDDARRALAELRRTLDDTGVEMPELPKEIAELWVQITEAKPLRRAHVDGTALMSARAREQLLEAGEIAAQRLLDIMGDDRLFGYAGLLTFLEQKDWLTLALARGFGTMAAGAQRVELPKEQQRGSIGATLQVLVRAKQQARDEHDDGLVDGVVDGELVDADGYEDQ